MRNRGININTFESFTSREVTPISELTVPFGWITRRGDIIQDYAIEVGQRRTADLIYKHDTKLSYEKLFEYWVRIDGLTITINTEPTKKQVDMLVAMFNAFPQLYNKCNERIVFVSNEYAQIKYNGKDEVRLWRDYEL